MDRDGSASRDTSRPLLHDLDERLTRLITILYPDERKRPGYARLARLVRERTGGTISATYLWELATGRKRNVTLEQLAVLARFFGVPLEYFIDDDLSHRVNAQLALAVALRDTKVRSLALRAEGLSSASLDALLTIVNEARRVENLEHVDEEETLPDDPTHDTAQNGAGDRPEARRS
jgi:transcriptional regulator with XRE-family HTH domain